jgi:hypothetical protein
MLCRLSHVDETDSLTTQTYSVLATHAADRGDRESKTGRGNSSDHRSASSMSRQRRPSKLLAKARQALQASEHDVFESLTNCE